MLLKTLDNTVSVQRGNKLDYALPMRTDYEETQNLKLINELKSIHKQFSLKSEMDDGLSSCSNFPELPLSYELETDKTVLPEIEHLKGKISEGGFEFLRAVSNRNAVVF